MKKLNHEVFWLVTYTHTTSGKLGQKKFRKESRARAEVEWLNTHTHIFHNVRITQYIPIRLRTEFNKPGEGILVRE